MTTRPECPLVQERLPALLENALPRGETALVKAHLEGCAACAEEAGAWTRLRADVKRTRPGPPGLDVALTSLAHALDRERQHRVRRRAIVAAAAALLAAVLLAFEPPRASLRSVEVASRALRSQFERARPQFLPESLSFLTTIGDVR